MNQRLQTSSVRLQAASDRLGKQMSGVEAGLQRLNLGIEAWVAVDPHTLFGYARIGTGRWRLAIQTVNDGAQWIRPLEECPRVVRVAAVPLLPVLFTELAEAAERLLPELEKAANLAQEIATAMAAEMANIGWAPSDTVPR